MVADHRVGVGTVRGPVVTGEVSSSRHARGKGAAMRIRSGQYVVFVTGAFGTHPAVHELAFFRYRIVLKDKIGIALDIAVQIREATGDEHAISVVPGPVSDAVARALTAGWVGSPYVLR